MSTRDSNPDPDRPPMTFEQLRLWLEQPSPDEREAAYKYVLHGLRTNFLPYSDALYHLLCDRQASETSEKLRGLAELAATAARLASTAESQQVREQLDPVLRPARKPSPADQTPPPAQKFPPGTLSEFIWGGDCQSPPRLVYPEEGRRLGDSEAVMDLIGFLTTRGLPEPKRLAVAQRGFCEEDWRTDEFLRFIYIARSALLLPTEKALGDWLMPNARYAFPDFDTPRGPQSRWPSPEYHCILEKVAPGIPPIRHAATLHHGELADYGLVQVYTVNIHGRHVRVIVCAGATRLATHVAVYLATKQLALSHAPDDSYVMAPPKRARGPLPDSLEIFFRAWTTLRDENHVPSQFRWEILDFRSGRKCIPAEAFRPASAAPAAGGNGHSASPFPWVTPTAKNITLYYQGRQPSITNIVAAWIDGSQADFKFTADNQAEYTAGRLLAALALHKKAGRATVPFATLAANTSIWVGGATADEGQVVGQAKTIRCRYVGDAMLVDDKAAMTCTLKANVRFIAR